MKSLQRIFLLLSLVGSFGIASAQQAYNLLLRTGNVVPEANAEDFARNFSPAKTQVHNGKYHLVVQFQAIPTPAERTAIEQLGVSLLDYLPHNAYIASIPVALDLSTLSAQGVRAFMVPDARVRLEKGIYQGTFPDWTRHGDMVELVVKPYRGIAKAGIVDALRTRCWVMDEVHHPTLVTVRIQPERVRELLELPFVCFVGPVSAPSTPDDTEGRSLHRSNTINASYGAGRHYDGTGVTVGLADDGTIGPHIDYTGRLTQYATSNTGNHGDMTSGIFFGAGNRDPQIQGHASGAYMHYWDIGGYVHIIDGVTHLNTLGLVLTSTSYSQGTGGMYTTDSEFIDDQIYDNPQMEHVFSAGNAGTSDHGYGAGAGWANITGGYKAAKSVITCGNLNNTDVLENSSSRGPADDGRIKPDICANGADQLSTDAPNTNQVGGGTSAAAPSIAGCVTQLYHAYKTLNGGQNPRSALIKACILNTAEDLGNAGPDYKHGWGRINALHAVRTLEENRYLVDSVSQGQTKNHVLNVPAGTSQLRVMVYWTDYPGSPSASKALVNDLNMTVTNGTVYQPWILNPAPSAASLNAVATRGNDDLNNVEQVTITNPQAGSTTVTISGGTVPQGPQRYYVVYEYLQAGVELTYPLGGEGLVPTEIEKIRWDAYGTSGTFTLEYSTNNGTTWTNIANNVGAGLRTYNWTVPNNVTGQARVRVTNGAFSDQSDAPFTIVRVPTNLQVTYVCPDSIGLSWTAAASATGYEASHLGAMYMDSVGVTTGTSIAITGLNPSLSHWFSVSTLTANNGQGRRAVAIEHPGGILNCVIPVDVEMQAILGPGAGATPDCQASATSVVSVQVRNNGTSAASAIPVRYSINGGAAVNETMSGPIAPGASATYNFTTTVNLSVAGTYQIEAWVDLPADGNFYNDTLSHSTTIVASSTQNIPLTENFESFSLCGTSTNCEAEICPLGNNWTNADNLSQDDIDWRVSQGSTPSTGTGPDVDHNPGTASGNYIYLEASGACEQKVAQLLSPCVDLTNATTPQLIFWYHMYGADMGELHVDVVAEGIWTMDAMTPVSGNQSNLWRQGTVNLAPWAGKVINIRFRGITGNGFASDMALDDMTISEASAAPVVDFTADATTACVNSTVTFTDMSINNPNSWSWNISPGTFTYVGGTSATSQNPQVQFSAPGTYSVTLDATNGFGTSTLTRNAYITVTSGIVPTITEDFNGTFTPTGWSIASAGGSNTWDQATNITGSNGASTDAAYMENFVYNNPGAEDKLITMPIDLQNSTSATMTFDVAYAPYNTTLVDGLRIDISTDCGVTYTPTAYNKSGTTLATAGATTSSWAPGAAGDWRNETVDLTPWVGNVVKISFVGINGYGNNLYVDNVNITSVISGTNLALETGWRFYPNPSQGSFVLEVDEVPATGAQVTITDLAGRTVHQATLSGSSGTYRGRLELGALPSGVYTLALQIDGAKEVKKLMIR